MPPDPRTDSDAGDTHPDWGAVWQRHARWLRTVILSRLAERDAADDVLQQVALAFANRQLRPSEPDRLAPWLYRVAIRQCLLYRRTAGRGRRLVERFAKDRVGVDGDAGGTPLDWLLDEERVGRAMRELRELPELDRQVLLLKYTEDWSYRQLAEHLGVSVNTIEYRLQLARERLRQRLTRDVAEVTT